MPVAQLTLQEGRTKEQIKRAIEGISDVICRELNVEAALVTVLVTELPATHIGKNGTTIDEAKKKAEKQASDP
jgi:4-oxalocrotonate tautomerase family enzyme